MSDLDVTPNYLEGLASHQDRAAGEIATGTDAPKGTAEKIWYDHGVLCGHTAQALKACVADRKRTGETMKAVSDAMAANLRQAAADYSATDEGTGEVLDKQMLHG
jgi:transposase